MKNIIKNKSVVFTSLVASVSLVSLLASQSAFAASATTTETAAQHVAAIQARGDGDINDRVTTLNNLIAKVNAALRLTPTQKTALTTEMQNQITSLTALETTLNGETTVDAAKTDFQDIFSQHYIYAFYIPRVNRLIAADAQLDAEDTMSSLIPKLQSYINIAEGQGNDVTSLNSAMASLQTNLSAAQAQTNSVISSLMPLTASGYPGNKTIVDTAGDSLKTSQGDLSTARANVQTVVTGLRKILSNVQ